MSHVSPLKLLGLTTLSILLTACGSQSADPDSPEGQRQADFKRMLNSSESLDGMLRGRLAFDADIFAAHVQRLVELTDAPWEYFPEPDDSRQPNAARPSVWSDAAGFADAIERYQQAVAELAVVTAEQGNEPDALLPALTGVQQACRGCHDDYRR
ncbi:c-type cytochrome [Halopseudomonas salegens]|uniref:Cytochrome c556 n=1 Tax=Halopseudomonas salegens TaxID=1434072 RepID=A0A1H2DXU1_9GAMM|nr:cytochrome c [Halopseudomonas salegens]SDT87681.1 Cytochrome c556 [Halopseudomonas salegens]